MARPTHLTDETMVYLCTSDDTKKLQANSLKRLVVQSIVANGGKMKVGEIKKIGSGFDDPKPTLRALIRTGWLKL